MNYPKVFNLKNNLTVIIDKYPHVDIVSMGLFADVGSRVESISNNGISHFLEHMFFKGTKTRDMYQISEEIESKGGMINAWTSKDKTAWYSKISKEDTFIALDIVFDIVNNSIFPEHELEKEKKVVIEEIKQSLDEPDDLLYNYFQSLCYTGNSLSLPILGTTETVNSFKVADLKQHISKYYSSNNMIFSIAGNVDEEKILEKIETIFIHNKHSEQTNLLKAQHSSNKAVLIKENLAQNQIIISYPGATLLDENYYVYIIISSILGRGMSSRLFKEIREKRGLAYSVYTFNCAYKDVGSLAIHAYCSYENVLQVIDLIRLEVNKLSKVLISTEELQKAKKQIISNIYMALESSYNRAERWALNYLNFNRIISLKEIIDKVNRVTKEDILEIAKILQIKEPVIALLSCRNIKI